MTNFPRGKSHNPIFDTVQGIYWDNSVKIRLPEIRHNQEGFEALVSLRNKTKECLFDDIEIDMTWTSWFDADMCGPFGAILYKLSDNMNTVKVVNVPSAIAKILSKNGFLSHYGGDKLPDTWGTTIPYKRFEAKDDRYFASYIEEEFVRRSEMPRMSVGLLKKFRESVFEIFSNAVIHSQTKLGIFSCGQYFPKRNRLDFAVADLGIGIRRNVLDNVGLNLKAAEAISWATVNRNTTKRGRIPGGLGLKLLREFISLNGGRIQIVSDSGYWALEEGEVITSELKYRFPGTVVSIEIDAADKRSYKLSSEVSEKDIF